MNFFIQVSIKINSFLIQKKITFKYFNFFENIHFFMPYIFYSLTEFGKTSNICWSEREVTFKICCIKGQRDYKEECGIKFLLQPKYRDSDGLKLFFKISENKIVCFSNEKKTEFIGWLNIPFYHQNRNIVFGETYLKEEDSINLKIFTNQYLEYKCEISKNQNLYLIIFKEKKDDEFCHYKLKLTRKENLFIQHKMMGFSHILKSTNKFFYWKKTFIEIKINETTTCLNTLVNFDLIQQGIDFIQEFSFKKMTDSYKISCDFTSRNEQKINYSVTFTDLIKLNKSNASKKIHAAREYNGEEMTLNVSNAELFLPSNCLNSKETISIEKSIQFKKENKSIIIKNLINCKPDGLKFLKPLKLRMISSTNNPRSIKSKDIPLEVDNGLFEQTINRFSENGLESVWDKDHPYKKFSYYFQKGRARGSLKMVFSIFDATPVEVG